MSHETCKFVCPILLTANHQTSKRWYCDRGYVYLNNDIECVFQTEMDITFKEKTNFLRSRIPKDLDHLALKFRGYWDNRYDVEGDLHFYEVLYYLEDDTMELIEEIPDERKMHGTSRKLIVKRQKLPRVRCFNEEADSDIFFFFFANSIIGDHDFNCNVANVRNNFQSGPWSVPPSYYNKQEILKVISKSPTQFYYKMDTRLLRDDDDWYYTYHDLYIGANLNVYNRSIILVKCDEFTKNYYKIVFGMGENNIKSYIYIFHLFTTSETLAISFRVKNILINHLFRSDIGSNY